MIRGIGSICLCICVFIANGRGASIFQQNSENVEAYLRRYGYLEDDVTNGDRARTSPVVLERALREFQSMAGLPVTGLADQSTLVKMAQPRCGSPDRQPGANLRYRLEGTKWEKSEVTWSAPERWSTKLPHGQQLRAMREAMSLWREVANLDIRETTGDDADIKTLFASLEHGDGHSNKFDGPGGVLAHAYPPGPGGGGDTHFDADEDWAYYDPDHVSLKLVAAHEFGHALGLAHSTDFGALMAPFYQWIPGYPLNRDDVAGITSLYGMRPGYTLPPTTLSTTPTTTTPTTTTPTTTTTLPTTTTISPFLPHYCQPEFNLDAAAGGPGAVHYLFRGSHVYKTDAAGLTPGFPVPILNVFPGGPNTDIDAAVYVPENDRHYLFQGSRVWRYTGLQLDAGHPKTWLSSADYYTFKPDAVVAYDQTQGGNSRIFMFGGRKFWEWNEREERVSSVGVHDDSEYWRDVPEGPDAAATDHRGDYFFFKGNWVYKVYRGRNANSKTPPARIGHAWFGKVCFNP